MPEVYFSASSNVRCEVAWFCHQGAVASDDTESKYQSQYEEKLDPFSSFSRKERTRKYMNLTAYDKITLSMVRRRIRRIK